MFFDNGIPLVAYPAIEGCLGLKADGSRMRIREGYVVMSFNYDVKPVFNDCLFNMKEKLEGKGFDMLKKASDGNDKNEHVYNEVMTTMIKSGLEGIFQASENVKLGTKLKIPQGV